MHGLRALLVAAVAAATLGCGGGDAGPSPSERALPSDAATSTPPTEPTDEAAGPALPADAEVPVALFDDVVGRAVGDAGVQRSAIEVVRAEAVTWRDGSLGCPQAGQSAVQVLTEGFWIVLDADGQQLDYRTAGTDTVLRCEEGGEPPLDDR